MFGMLAYGSCLRAEVIRSQLIGFPFIKRMLTQRVLISLDLGTLSAN